MRVVIGTRPLRAKLRRCPSRRCAAAGDVLIALASTLGACQLRHSGYGAPCSNSQSARISATSVHRLDRGARRRARRRRARPRSWRGARDRDRFVLSKGHARLALYAALHDTGVDAEQLATFCGDGSCSARIPSTRSTGVDFSTGSLGQGSRRRRRRRARRAPRRDPQRTFACSADAECNEGSVWEAVMFAAHHRLADLIAIVDVNGQQALGYTRDVLDLAPLDERWRAFGWDVHDGRRPRQPRSRATSRPRAATGRPHVLLAHTTFGKRRLATWSADRVALPADGRRPVRAAAAGREVAMRNAFVDGLLVLADRTRSGASCC